MPSAVTDRHWQIQLVCRHPGYSARLAVAVQADAVAVWKSSCRKRAHSDMTAATPASGISAVPAVTCMQQPGGTPACAVAVQTPSVPLLLQPQGQQGLQQGLAPAEHGRPDVQLQQQPKLPDEHAQTEGCRMQQTPAPYAVQAKQANDSAMGAEQAGQIRQAPHATLAKQAQQAVQAKQAQHAPPATYAQHALQQAQRIQHALPAQRALPATPAQHAQHGMQAVTNTQRSVQLPAQQTQQAKQTPPAQPAVTPQVAQRTQYVQPAAKPSLSMAPQPSEQLHPKRPAPSADDPAPVKRHKVHTQEQEPNCFCPGHAHSFSLCTKMFMTCLCV